MISLKNTLTGLVFYSLFIVSSVFAGSDPIKPKGDDSLPALVMTEMSIYPASGAENYTTFYYQAFNTGRSEAVGALMTNQPRNGYIYVSHVCQPGWTPQVYRSDDGRVVATCENGTLAPGANARMEVTLKNPLECMGTPYVPLINHAAIYSRNAEMDYSDNEVESRIYLLTCPSSGK